MTERIYLDHAATSPLRPEAKAAMEEGFRIWANPSSPHAEGRKAKAALEDARERIKTALGWDGELIFTSGASEALWIALNRAKVDRRIVSAVEHDAVFRAAPDAEVVDVLHGRGGGFLDQEKLKERLVSNSEPAVVCLQHVNSETGTMQDVEGAFASTKASNSLLLSDCSQSAGKYELPEADMIVVSAHKLGGPIGIGALLVRNFNILEPGGGHERGYRQGTENLPAIMGFASAIEEAAVGKRRALHPKWADPLNSVFNRFEIEFEKRGGFEVLGGDPTIRALCHPSLSAQTQVIRFDAMGFAVSAGSACSSGTLKKSRVLDAFGVSDEVAARTIRVSIGWNTTPADLDKFAEAWKSLT